MLEPGADPENTDVFTLFVACLMMIVLPVLRQQLKRHAPASPDPSIPMPPHHSLAQELATQPLQTKSADATAIDAGTVKRRLLQSNDSQNENETARETARRLLHLLPNRHNNGNQVRLRPR